MNTFNNSGNLARSNAKGGVVMDKVKFLNHKMFIAFAVVAISIMALVPAMALAADYPGVDDGTVTTGSTASTQVGLKTDESQLSFTAPAVINFAMKADGTFEYPTTAKFTNNSIFDLKVAGFTVACDEKANGVSTAAYDTATGDNTYKVQIKPGTGALLDFAVSQDLSTSTEWKIPHATGANTLALGFDNGVMKNVTSDTWADGHKLQDVVWTVAAA